MAGGHNKVEHCSGSHIKESGFRSIDLSLALALSLRHGLNPMDCGLLQVTEKSPGAGGFRVYVQLKPQNPNEALPRTVSAEISLLVSGSLSNVNPKPQP